MKKRLKPKVKRIIYALSALVVAIVAIMGYVAWDEYSYRFSSAVVKSGVIKIYPEDSFTAVVSMLEKEGYIRSSKGMERMAIKHDKDSVKVGSYYLSEGESYRTLLTRLFAGRQTPVKITFNNIRTLDKLAEVVSRKTLATQEEFADHFASEATKSGDKANYIARFMPNTYEVYWTITPAEFSNLMLEYYNKFWDADSRRDKAEKLGLTPEQAMTLASIVIEETKAESEMTEVAGVYINRITKGIPLQADPTVKFAVGDFSIKRILHKHLSIDSPYNTYKNKGLPPGPICSPAIVAIDAVLDYGDNRHKWLYFCANADFSGTHSFAANLEDHNRNAKAYHRALNARGIR